MRLTWAERARIGGATAALTLAVLSRGDSVSLFAAIAVCLWRPATALAAALALGAASWRWGSSSLEAWAGGQAVLGPAGWLEPPAAAAGAWLAAAALVLCAPVPGWRTVVGPLVGGGTLATVELPRRSVATALASLAVGLAAADVVAGPSLSERPWVRIAGAVGGMAAAFVVQRVRRRGPAVVDLAAVAAAAASLAFTAADAPTWRGTVEGAEVRAGLVLACGVGAAAAVGSWVLAAMGQLRR